MKQRISNNPNKQRRNESKQFKQWTMQRSKSKEGCKIFSQKPKNEKVKYVSKQ